MEKRKKDHIKLALNQLESYKSDVDSRFFYEPMLSSLQNESGKCERHFLGKKCQSPLWISSMTGGLEQGKEINRMLARAAKKFQLVFALGSCRPILKNNHFFHDFNMRKELGEDAIFLANLGIAQMSELKEKNDSETIKNLCKALGVDGLIIHINPIQEWAQPEGDRYESHPLDVIKWSLDVLDIPLIVKEVGQGFGPKSLHALSELPLAGIELAGYGGTNFVDIERQRNKEGSGRAESVVSLCSIGHKCEDMLSFLIPLKSNIEKNNISLIFSGGMRNSIDGFYYMSHFEGNNFYGQASKILKYALQSENILHEFIEQECANLHFAHQMLTLRK